MEDEQLAIELRQVFNKMAWLNKEKMEKQLQGYTDSEVHCIEAIGRLTDPNVTKLAEFLYMTKGAISKLTKRLIAKGAVERYRKPENKKEIYFHLTESGQTIFMTHERLHQEFRERDKPVLDQLTEKQVAEMKHFLAIYSEHLDKEIDKQGLTLK